MDGDENVIDERLEVGTALVRAWQEVGLPGAGCGQLTSERCNVGARSGYG
jgi:hypothetical protein